MRNRLLAASIAAFACALLTACGGGKMTGSGTTTTSSGGSSPAVPSSKHIVIVMEENQDYSTVVGNTSIWPNLNNLIAHGALPTNDYANMHGSISEYFMLTCGQTLTDDDSSTEVWNVPNIARSMLAANIPFRVYAEGITRGYIGGDTGAYDHAHNPFPMYSDVADNPQVAMAVLWPFTQFAADLTAGALPEYSFIVPDIYDDAHTGTPAQADAWLAANVIGPLASYSAFKAGGDGVLIVDFDEGALSDTAHGGGHIAPVLWGPIVKVGYRQTSATLYQQQSMLLTIMDSLGLSNPPGAAASAPAMGEFFVQPSGS